jgi:hydrogenase/urease accessory protein HupE
MKTLSLAVTTALTAVPALAHPGHSAAEEMGLAHWFTQGDHITAIAVSLTVAVALGVLRYARRG